MWQRIRNQNRHLYLLNRLVCVLNLARSCCTAVCVDLCLTKTAFWVFFVHPLSWVWISQTQHRFGSHELHTSASVHNHTQTRPHSSVSRPFWRLCWLLDSDMRPNLKYCSDLEMTAEQKPQYGYLFFHVNTCIAGRWRKRLSCPSKLFCFAYGSNWVYSGVHREQTVNHTTAFDSHTLRL